MKGYEYQSDFAEKFLALGRTVRVTPEFILGFIEGFTEGRTEEAARAVLTVLRVRGLVVSDAVRERILAQKDLKRLERWLEEAALATSVAPVLDDPS